MYGLKAPQDGGPALQLLSGGPVAAASNSSTLLPYQSVVKGDWNQQPRLTAVSVAAAMEMRGIASTTGHPYQD